MARARVCPQGMHMLSTLLSTPLVCLLPLCTVLYCTLLYCTVLYCTVLYCTVLYCTVLMPTGTCLIHACCRNIHILTLDTHSTPTAAAAHGCIVLLFSFCLTCHLGLVPRGGMMCTYREAIERDCSSFFISIKSHAWHSASSKCSGSSVHLVVSSVAHTTCICTHHALTHAPSQTYTNIVFYTIHNSLARQPLPPEGRVW